MLSHMPERLTGISHPQIASMYLKKFCGRVDESEDVLVIETNFKNDKDEYENFDSYLIDLLEDLNELQIQVEQKIGKFDRIDIRN